MLLTPQGIGLALLACSLWMLLLWGVQLRSRDAGVVDFGWAAAIGALAVLAARLADGAPLQRGLAGLLGAAWGFRLAGHLLRDRVLPAGEDGRYAYLRAHWGSRSDLHFFWFFQVQALLAWLLALPFMLLAEFRAAALAPVQILGLVLFLVAQGGEVLSDRQLARFRRDPQNRGQVCDRGLWRYSRHPNYFFAWLVWCAVAMVAWPAPHGAWAILAPAAMYLLVTRISGIPYTEAQALRRRGEAYRRYQEQTNAFFPGPTAGEPAQRMSP